MYRMSKPFNPNNDDFRRQYINHLVTERCSTVDISSDEASTGFHNLLTKLVDKGLSYLEERVLDGYCSGLKKVDINNKDSLQRHMNGYIYIEDYLMQTYRNRMVDGISDINRDQTHQGKPWCFSKRLCPNESSMYISMGLLDQPHDRTHKYIHQEILTQVRPEILEDVSLDSSAIMDRMIEDRLMTEDERQSIIQEKTPKRRKEEFLLLMKGRLCYKTLVSENATSLECKCIDMKELVLENYSESTDRTLVPDVANLDDLESQLDPSEDGSSVSALEQMEVVMDDGRVQTTFDTFEIRQDNKQIGKKGGVLVSSVFSEMQVQFPEGALKSTVNVGLQTQVIAPELIVRHLNNAAATSPIVTIQPRCWKVHKPITLTIPTPKMRLIKRDLRLLYSISDYREPDVWKDITDAKQIRLDNDFVTFTSMVSARFWLIDCANKDVEDVAKIANALYNDSIVAVQKKKQHTQEKDKKGLIGSTDDTTDNTLEKQENDAANRTLENYLITKTVTFTELSKSTDTLW